MMLNDELRYRDRNDRPQRDSGRREMMIVETVVVAVVVLNVQFLEQ